MTQELPVRIVYSSALRCYVVGYYGRTTYAFTFWGARLWVRWQEFSRRQLNRQGRETRYKIKAAIWTRRYAEGE